MAPDSVHIAAPWLTRAFLKKSGEQKTKRSIFGKKLIIALIAIIVFSAALCTVAFFSKFAGENEEERAKDSEADREIKKRSI